ncbi:MAG: repair protein RecO [Hyphomicrobiales bacterium]|jgi:DNA repair protein RecO (recombination protein O)|nr:repair protein RecO [Hyphomicrobiales bacterium]
MDWTDEGIVLGVRRHGETSAILEVMTRAHGRHLGLVRGGSGSRMRPVLQPGNVVRVTWRARLDEHLGHYVVEGLRLRAGEFMIAAHAAFGVTHLAALCRLLPERDPHEQVHDALADILDHLEDRTLAAALIARFELQFLAELGFGLDLDQCAATGVTAGLDYVSPKSGRAVSRTAGEPWRDRMLRLPAFLRAEQEADEPTADELTDAFALTGFFLTRHVLEPRGLPMHDARASFISAVLRNASTRAAS